MKYFILLAFALFACTPQKEHTQILQNQIDSLVANAYRPGFGEFMSSIQVHHAKLWFAGKNQNWDLADFEMNEIRESLADIQKYCTDRPESKIVPMINAPMDSLDKAIQQKDVKTFKVNFINLTNTCNSCHQATSHGFNVIQVPENPPFSNQKI